MSMNNKISISADWCVAQGDDFRDKRCEKRPKLIFVERPERSTRYRYESERKTGHGHLYGVNTVSPSPKSDKTYTTVKLLNYSREAVLKAQLYDAFADCPHPADEFLASEKKTQHLSQQNSYQASFKEISITMVTKKELKEWQNNTGLCEKIDLRRVRLRFRAFDALSDREICEPLDSDPIVDNRSNPDLKILDILPYRNYECGRLWIIIEGVSNKDDVELVFYENTSQGRQEFATIKPSKLELVKLTLIKTEFPRYTGSVLNFELRRISDGVTSEPRTLEYKPRDCGMRHQATQATYPTSTPSSSTSDIELEEPRNHLRYTSSSESECKVPRTPQISESSTDAQMYPEICPDPIYLEDVEVSENRPHLDYMGDSEVYPGSDNDMMYLQDIPFLYRKRELLDTHLNANIPICIKSDLPKNTLSLANEHPSSPVKLEVSGDIMNKFVKSQLLHDDKDPVLSQACVNLPTPMKESQYRNDTEGSMMEIDNTDMPSMMIAEILQNPNPWDSDSAKPRPDLNKTLNARQPKIVLTKPLKKVKPVSINKLMPIIINPLNSGRANSSFGVDLIKKLIGEICELAKQDLDGNSEEISRKLEDLFAIRCANGDTFLYTTLTRSKASLEKLVTLMYALRVTHLLNAHNDLGQTILHLAVVNDLPAVVSLLIANGCSIKAYDHWGLSPLHYAVSRRSCLRAMLAALAPQRVPSQTLDIYSDEKQTPLHMAVTSDYPYGTMLLLRHGASPSVRDSRHRTSLHCAVLSDRADTARLIAQYCTAEEIDLTDSEGYTALQLACLRHQPNSLSIATLLLEKQANPLKHAYDTKSAWELDRDNPELSELINKYVCSTDLSVEHTEDSHSGTGDGIEEGKFNSSEDDEKQIAASQPQSRQPKVFELLDLNLIFHIFLFAFLLWVFYVIFLSSNHEVAPTPRIVLVEVFVRLFACLGLNR